jgi:hypothetical protein
LKALKGVEFSDVQLHRLGIEAKKRNLTVEQLVESYTRRHLNHASGRVLDLKRNNVVTFEGLNSDTEKQDDKPKQQK